jgi:hypothetical protein
MTFFSFTSLWFSLSFLDTHTYTHRHTYIRKHTHSRTHTRTHTDTHAHMHTHTHIYTLVNTNTAAHKHKDTDTYTHIHTHHTHTCTQGKQLKGFHEESCRHTQRGQYCTTEWLFLSFAIFFVKFLAFVDFFYNTFLIILYTLSIYSFPATPIFFSHPPTIFFSFPLFFSTF